MNMNNSNSRSANQSSSNPSTRTSSQGTSSSNRSNQYSSTYNILDFRIFEMLSLMYNDNNRQIENLMNENHIIRETITQMISANLGQNLRRSTNRRRTNNSTYNPIDSILRYTLPTTNTTTQFNNTFTSFFDPVEVFPSQAQYELATRVVQFSQIQSPINTTCPISLEMFSPEQYVTQIRHCNHVFSTTNIQNWFLSNCRCPVCRYDIRDFQVDASNNEITNNTSTSYSQLETPSRINENSQSTLIPRSMSASEIADQITNLLLNQMESGDNNANSTDASNNGNLLNASTFFFRYT